MRQVLLHFAIVMFFLLTAASACPAQTCGGQTCPGTLSCTSTCYIYCEQQLRDAIDCYKNSGSCSHIIIDDQTTLNLCDIIELTGEHSGLHITIEGTLRWYGSTSDSICYAPTMISISGTEMLPAYDITIDGSGSGSRLITSNYTACQVWQPAPGSTQFCDPQDCTSPSGGVISIAKAITMSGYTHDVTVANLNFSQLSSAIEVDSSNVHTLTFNGLYMQNLRGYGVFASCDRDVTINNCHVLDAYGDHGFRTYADGVTITNSSAENSGSTGFWVVEGRGVNVDEFTSTGQRVIAGPNHACCDPSDRLLDVDIRNVTVVGDVIGNEKMQVNLGLIGAWFDNIENDLSQTIALGPVDIERPMNKIYWGTLSGTVSLSHSCVGPETGHRSCKYDIDDSGAVDVLELLAVIDLGRMLDLRGRVLE